jgi:hypothetical protein
MSERTCLNCPNPVAGRRKFCPSCRRQRRADQERIRYRDNAEAISTRRSLRRQGATQYDGPRDDEPAIDYTKGSPRPELRPLSAYKDPRHDAALRARLDYAAQHAGEDDLPDQISWDDIVDRPTDTRVYFPPPAWSPAATGNPLRSYDAPGPPDHPDVAGVLYRPNSASCERALFDHLRRRR